MTLKYQEAQEELISFEHTKEEERIQRGMIEKEVLVWRERALEAEKRLDEVKDEIDGTKSQLYNQTALETELNELRKARVFFINTLLSLQARDINYILVNKPN